MEESAQPPPATPKGGHKSPRTTASPWSLKVQHQHRETSPGQLKKPQSKISKDTSPRKAEAVPLFTVRENDSYLTAGNNLEGCPVLKREKTF